MTTNPYDDDISCFSVTFLRALIAWNHCEDMARHILIALCGGGIGALAAVNQLGNVSLRPEDADWELKRDHIQHFCAGFELLRPYRNFYVHSLKAVGKAPADPTKFVGLLINTEVKGKVRHVSQGVEQAELSEFHMHCERLGNYSRLVALHFEKVMELANPHALRPLGTIEKPAWPKQLVKVRTEHYYGE